MATWDDVRRLASALPETTEGSGTQAGGRVWRVRDTMFAWERALRRTDVQALEELGAKVTLIGQDELAWGDLSTYDVIMTGVRAYERRADLRAYNRRLLDFLGEEPHTPLDLAVRRTLVGLGHLPAQPADMPEAGRCMPDRVALSRQG